MTDPLRVAVLGAGNWGTTLAHLIASNGCRVRLWTRDRDRHDEINERHTNQRAQAGLILPPGVRAVLELGDALREVDLIFVVVPSPHAEPSLPLHSPVETDAVFAVPPLVPSLPLQ